MTALPCYLWGRYVVEEDSTERCCMWAGGSVVWCGVVLEMVVVGSHDSFKGSRVVDSDFLSMTRECHFSNFSLQIMIFALRSTPLPAPRFSPCVPNIRHGSQVLQKQECLNPLGWQWLFVSR